MPIDEESLRVAESELWTRMLAHLRASKVWQDRIKCYFVLLGAALSGLSQLALAMPDWLKIASGTLGAVLALVGGLLLLKVEQGFYDVVEQARSVLDMGGAAVKATERIEESQRRLQAALEREQSLGVMFDNMIQFLENALAMVETTEQRLQTFVGSAGPTVVESMQLNPSDDWTISVFCKGGLGSEERMFRIASCWKDQRRSLTDARSWHRGKGWTGEAWSKGEQGRANPYVIEADASTANARARYDTDGEERPEDLEKYHSVVSIPLRVRGKPGISLVVTATSSVVGTFGMDLKTRSRRNFDTIRSFSLLIAALAASDDPTSLLPAAMRGG